MISLKLLLNITACGLLFLGCRGQVSEKPPIHLNPNMDDGPRFDPYEANSLFPDRRGMRPILEGTVPNQQQKDFGGYYAEVGLNPVLDSENPYFQGHTDSKFVTTNPERITLELMERGRERYDIYCGMCHGPAGVGNGIVVKKGFLPPPDFADARILGMAEGEIFSVISHGVRNMPGYGKQITAADRWAIVAYVRALQRARNSAISDVPADKSNQLN